ncbi:ATP-dependent DNA helicase RecG, partial [Candidatus Woesebacteria bacterium]|nr:ATP-dependent DNA helicase RecG [Candidatus Woesebacteria bacterium]
MKPDSPIQSVPLVGSEYARRLQKLAIMTAGDLIYHIPHRYDDYSLVSDMSRLQPGETVTIRGQITAIKNQYTRGGRKIQMATVSDGERNIEVTWFNQPFIIRTLPEGTWVSLSGKINWFGRKRVLVSPEYEKLPPGGETDTIHTGRLVPVYPETYGVSSKWLRSRTARLLPQIIQEFTDFLPENIRKKNKLMELSEALQKIHFPENLEDAQKARKRLAFDEFFEIQLAALLRRKNWKNKKLAHKLHIDQTKVLELTNSLPFQLTQAQKRTMREILADLGKGHAMNRLLEGDVGSGKTVVAALACLVSFDNGFQS